MPKAIEVQADGESINDLEVDNDDEGDQGNEEDLENEGDEGDSDGADDADDADDADNADHTDPKAPQWIETPSNTDVLLGRGVGTNRHPGNKTFRDIVSQHADAYVSGTRTQKTMISRSIVDAVKKLQPSGRFLEKNPETGWWLEVEDKRALEKTAQNLRDAVMPKATDDTNDLEVDNDDEGDADDAEVADVDTTTNATNATDPSNTTATNTSNTNDTNLLTQALQSFFSPGQSLPLVQFCKTQPYTQSPYTEYVLRTKGTLLSQMKLKMSRDARLWELAKRVEGNSGKSGQSGGSGRGFTKGESKEALERLKRWDAVSEINAKLTKATTTTKATTKPTTTPNPTKPTKTQTRYTPQFKLQIINEFHSAQTTYGIRSQSLYLTLAKKYNLQAPTVRNFIKTEEVIRNRAAEGTRFQRSEERGEVEKLLREGERSKKGKLGKGGVFNAVPAGGIGGLMEGVSANAASKTKATPKSKSKSSSPKSPFTLVSPSAASKPDATAVSAMSATSSALTAFVASHTPQNKSKISNNSRKSMNSLKSSSSPASKRKSSTQPDGMEKLLHLLSILHSRGWRHGINVEDGANGVNGVKGVKGETSAKSSTPCTPAIICAHAQLLKDLLLQYHDRVQKEMTRRLEQQRKEEKQREWRVKFGYPVGGQGGKGGKGAQGGKGGRSGKGVQNSVPISSMHSMRPFLTPLEVKSLMEFQPTMHWAIGCANRLGWTLTLGEKNTSDANGGTDAANATNAADAAAQSLVSMLEEIDLVSNSFTRYGGIIVEIMDMIHRRGAYSDYSNGENGMSPLAIQQHMDEDKAATYPIPMTQPRLDALLADYQRLQSELQKYGPAFESSMILATETIKSLERNFEQQPKSVRTGKGTRAPRTPRTPKSPQEGTRKRGRPRKSDTGDTTNTSNTPNKRAKIAGGSGGTKPYQKQYPLEFKYKIIQAMDEYHNRSTVVGHMFGINESSVRSIMLRREVIEKKVKEMEASKKEGEDGKGGEDGDDPPITLLSRAPKDLYTLWNHYNLGIPGQHKPAKHFTRQERGMNRFSYSRRNIFWQAVEGLMQKGHTSDSAIEKIYSVYGRGKAVNTILLAMRKDRNEGNDVLGEEEEGNENENEGNGENVENDGNGDAEEVELEVSQEGVEGEGDEGDEGDEDEGMDHQGDEEAEGAGEAEEVEEAEEAEDAEEAEHDAHEEAIEEEMEEIDEEQEEEHITPNDEQDVHEEEMEEGEDNETEDIAVTDDGVDAIELPGLGEEDGG